MDAINLVQSFRFKRRLSLFFTLTLVLCGFLRAESAQLPRPLVMSTLAGDANYGSADGLAAVAKFYEPAGIAIDSVGNIYVADVYNDTVRKVSTNGVVTTMAGLAQVSGTNNGTGSAARFNGPEGVAVDASGNVYVADSFNNLIRKISPAGVVTTVAGSGVPGYGNGVTNFALFARPYGIAVDASGNIYIADTFNQLIRKISGGMVSTYAGTFNVTGTNDGIGTNASFNFPEAIAVDSLGNLYVADTTNQTIRLITTNQMVTNIAGASVTTFSNICGIAVDAARNVYFSDTGDEWIQKLSFNGSSWTPAVYAGNSLVGDIDGPAAGASFSLPIGLVVDGHGNVYVGDSASGNIRVITTNAMVSTYAGPVESAALIDGFEFNARLNQPNGIAVDRGGNIYAAEFYNNCVRRIDPAGNVAVIGGSTNGYSGYSDGPVGTSSFYWPTAVCVDSATNIYVTDYYYGSVRKISFVSNVWTTATIATDFDSPDGIAVDTAGNLYVANYYDTTIQEIATNGTISTFADGGTNYLSYPVGLAMDNSSNLYVADSGFNAIRIISTNGVIANYVSGGVLNGPQGVAVDGIGNVYVANTGASTILGILPDRSITNIAGSNYYVGSADGYDMTAHFDAPIGIAVDSSNNVYVGDTFNNTIRKGIPLSAASLVFSLDTVPSGFNIIANGTTYSNTPQSLTLAYSSSNTVSAVVTNGWAFTGWTSNGVSVSAGTNFSFVAGTNNIALVANYLPGYTLALVAQPSNEGTVSGAGNFVTNSTNTVIATPLAGYAFVNWTTNGIAASASSNYSFVLTSNITVTANFTPAYTITTSVSPANGGGTSGGGTFWSGTTNTVTATTNAGFAFTSWTSNGVVVATNLGYSFPLTANVSLVANFTPYYTATLSASPANGGSAIGSSGVFLAGTTNTVTASTNSGFVFSDWTTNGIFASSSPSYIYILTTNISAVAHFTPLFTINVVASPLAGGVVGGGGTFLSGTTNSVTATANAGYVFSNWTVGGLQVSTSNLYSFALATNVTVTANFVTTPPQITIYNQGSFITNGQTNAIDFGSVQQALADPLLTFAVTNLGGQALTISSISVPAGFILNTNFSNTIAALSNGSFSVQLNSSNIATYSGNIIVSNNDPTNGPFVFPVTGTVTPPAPRVAVFDGGVNITNGQGAALDFGRAQQGQSGPVVTFTITNEGGQPLSVGLPTVPGGFSILQAPPASIAAGQAGIFSVQALTTSVGTNTGSISFTNNDTNNNPFTFPVTAEITIPAPELLIYEGTNLLVNGGTNVINFGSAQQPAAGPTTTLILSNVGLQDLSLGSITLPTNYSLVTNAPATVSAGSNAAIEIQLSSSNAGVFAGTISVANNDPTNTPYVVQITGTILPPPPGVAVFKDGVAVTNGQPIGADFGSVQQNFAGPIVTFSVTNTGGMPLNLGLPAVPSGFMLVSNNTSVIQPGSNGMFSVQLLTGTVGVYSGNITFTNNDPTNSPFAFGVTGTVLSPPHIQVFNGVASITNGQTNIVNFASVQQNLAGSTVTFSVTNSGQEPLAISSVAVPNGFAIVTNLPGSIATNSGAMFTVTLITTNAGTNTGNISIVSGDPANSPFLFPVQGIVLAPPQIHLAVGGTNLINGQTNVVNFGSVQENLTGPVLIFSITNLGQVALSASVPGVPAGFIVSTNPPSSIAPGSNGSFAVQMLTTNIGTNAGNIVLTNGDPTNGVFIFPIRGVVLAPPQIAVFDGGVQITNGSATPIDFGSVQQDLTGGIVTFTLTNSGQVALSNLSIGLPTGFALLTNVPAAIVPGASGAFSVQLSSVTIGSKAGNVVITNNDPTNNPFTFAIAGTVTAPPTPDLELATGLEIITNNQSNAIDFGIVWKGQTGGTVTFTITNAGGQTLAISPPAVPAGFVLVSNPPSSLATDAHGTFVVQFAATNVGSSAGHIIITNNDPSHNPFVFPVVGFVANSVISLSGNLAFGGVPINQSATNLLTLSNGGNYPITVSNISYPSGYSGAFSSSIGAGSVQTVPVVFSPTAATNYTGTIVVHSDALEGTNTIGVSGYGASGTLVLTIDTTGQGTVTPNDNGKTFKAGAKVALTAKPAAGYLFSNWTGSVITNRNPLTVTIEPSTLLVANFVPNPFISVKGIYNGLFMTTNGVTEQTAGMLKNLNVTTKGTFTASLLLNGGTFPFSGTFGLGGAVTNKVNRSVAQGGPVIVTMNFVTPSNAAPWVMGTVTGGSWNSYLVADLATNKVSSGEFSVLILPDTNNAPPQSSPGGAGYVLITNYAGTAKNPALATARLTGALADGTVVNQTVPVSEDGYVPVYAALYANKGLLLGWINLVPTNQVGVNLTWIHPARAGLYSAGFENVLSTNEILLSPWMGLPTGWTNLSILPTAVSTNAATNILIAISSTGKVTGDEVTGTVNAKTGLVKITVGTGSSKLTAVGALLSFYTNGSGYILTKTNSQTFRISP